MNYSTQEVTKALKAARKNKGLSQRALAEKSGVLQTQISKIENDATDFRLSTLVALARALDLELTLIPRKAVSAVQSVVRASKPAVDFGRAFTNRQSKEYDRLRRILANLPDTSKLTTEYAQLQRNFRDIQKFQADKAQLERVRETANLLKALSDQDKVLKEFRNQDEALKALKVHDEALKAFRVLDKVPKELRHAAAEFQNMRNALAHASANVPSIDAVKPAYSLDEDDSDG